jgi:hypothetical protein
MTTVFLTRREDIDTVHQAIQTYEQATGALLNPSKSKAFMFGGWSTPIVTLGIEHINKSKYLE